MANTKAKTPALPIGARIIHQNGSRGIILQYPDGAPNFVDAFSLSTGAVRRWRNEEYSEDPDPMLSAESPARVFVVNAGIGVKISTITWGVLAANLVTVVVASLLYAVTR